MRVLRSGLEIERQDRNTGTAKECGVAVCDRLVTATDRLHKDFADRQATGEQPVAPRSHAASQPPYRFTKKRMLFKQVDEQIAVPEDVRQMRLLPVLASNSGVHQ